MKGRFTAMREMIKNAFQHGLREAATSLKWVVFSVLSGILSRIGGDIFFFWSFLRDSGARKESVDHLAAPDRRSADRGRLPAAPR